MNPLKKTLSRSLGLVVLGTVAVLITTGSVGATPHLTSIAATPQPHHFPVTVVNTPLPVTGSVNAAVTGNVNATVTGSVAVSNTPNVNVTNTPNVTVANTATSPVLVRNVNDGMNPFEVDLTLTNDTATWGPTTSTCNLPSGATQCQISFDVPAGQRLVVEHVSAYMDGASGQTYQAFIAGDLIEFLVLSKQISRPGVDTFTASQPMRVYVNSGRFPPPTVAVTNSNGGSFFARIDISGYLVPIS